MASRACPLLQASGGASGRVWKCKDPLPWQDSLDSSSKGSQWPGPSLSRPSRALCLAQPHCWGPLGVSFGLTGSLLCGRKTVFFFLSSLQVCSLQFLPQTVFNQR